MEEPRDFDMNHSRVFQTVPDYSRRCIPSFAAKRRGKGRDSTVESLRRQARGLGSKTRSSDPAIERGLDNLRNGFSWFSTV